MRRVVVVGTSGTGKTTVASRIAEAIDAPHIELDSLHWEPGWEEAPDDVFRARTSEATSGESWVADGNYGAVRDILWSRADTVVWLDNPLRVAFLRVVLRTLRRIVTREELWNGNREGLSALVGPDSMPLWVLKTHRRRRREYPELFASPEYSRLTVVRLGSTDETERWLVALSESQR
jgi:adenylate kinase family enzyme